MGKPPGFSEPYVSQDIDREKDQAEHGVSPKAATYLYIVVGVLCVVLFFLLMVALHIPRE